MSEPALVPNRWCFRHCWLVFFFLITTQIRNWVRNFLKYYLRVRMYVVDSWKKQWPKISSRCLFQRKIAEFPSNSSNCWSSFPFNYERRTDLILQSYLNLHTNDNPNDFLPVSTTPRAWEWGITLSQLPSPLHLFMWDGAGEWDWMGPPLSSVLANKWAGMRNKGQPLLMTKLYLSYILSSMFPGLCVPNFISHTVLWLVLY